jgi:hypothetical protein
MCHKSQSTPFDSFNPSVTLGFKFQLLIRMEFDFIVSFNAFTATQFTGLAAGECTEPSIDG